MKTGALSSPNMTEKKKLILEMIEMQRRFIDYDRKNKLRQEEYWINAEDHLLHDFKDRFDQKAFKVLELAHNEKDSKR